jgi:glycerophosphoryl diester phosphodiesterase
LCTKIFAHRGASKHAPENTMAAFQLAYELQADGIETDVQLTKDQVPVLMHDEHTRRTTGGSRYVKDLTWNELKQLDCGSWFDKKYEGTPVVTLETFLQWIKDKPLYLNIELKNNKIDYKHLEAIVFEQVKHVQLLEKTILSTFNPASIRRMKRLSCETEIAFLTSRGGRHSAARARELGAHAIHIKYRLLNQRLISECRKENMPVRVYTVNRPAKMKKCFKTGCDAIITDVPEKGIKYRDQLRRI